MQSPELESATGADSSIGARADETVHAAIMRRLGLADALQESAGRNNSDGMTPRDDEGSSVHQEQGGPGESAAVPSSRVALSPPATVQQQRRQLAVDVAFLMDSFADLDAVREFKYRLDCLYNEELGERMSDGLAVTPALERLLLETRFVGALIALLE